MRLGLVTDIHNDALQLSRALEIFRERKVDQVVTIGDSCDPMGFRDGAREVAELLQASQAIGVWGNHDFGFCQRVEGMDWSEYPEDLLAIMSSMQPRLEVEHCLFSHKDASMDPFNVLDLWELNEEPLDLWKKAQRGFSASRQRWQFIGHYHRWWAATQSGPIDWHGQEPLKFMPGDRYFVVVAAVCNGSCAILDLETNQLEPLNCRATT